MQASRRGEKGTWWTFFPMTKIDITDEKHSLDNFLFGDSTLVSRKHAGQIALWLRSQLDNPSAEVVALTEVQAGLEQLADEIDFHSLLVVRRVATFSDKSPEAEMEYNQVVYARAHQLAALIEIALYGQRGPDTCALVSQLPTATKKHYTLNPKTGFGMIWSLEPMPERLGFSKPRFTFTSTALMEMLNTAPYEGLTRALLPARPTLAASLVNSITQSAIRITEAIHTRNYTASVLNAITALEVLVSFDLDAGSADQERGYRVFEQRLKALVGAEALRLYRLDAILKVRHHYVHRGEDISLRVIPIRAITFAISCLFKYCEIAQQFSSKAAVIDYLDFVRLYDRMTESMNAMEYAPFAELIKHKRQALYFPWQQRSLRLDAPPYRHRSEVLGQSPHL